MRQGRLITIFAAGFATVAPMLANAQSENYLGPSVNIFMPTDSKLRDVMGDAWFSFGASRVNLDKYKKSKVGFDWNAFSKERGGSKVFMIAAGLGYTKPLTEGNAVNRPYFAVRAGLSYIDYALQTAPLTRLSSKRIGFNANAELGVNLGERLNLSARYDFFPRYEGISFSGLSLALKWGIVKF